MVKTNLPGSGLTVTTPGVAGGPASRAKKRAADKLGGKKATNILVGKSCGQAGWEKRLRTDWVEKKKLPTDWLEKNGC